MATITSTLKEGVKRLTTTVTATDTTAAGDIGTVRGKILKIQVSNDTGSCGWWIFSDASDNSTNEGDIVDEDIFGATGAGHVDGQNITIYPVRQLKTNDNTATDPDQYTQMIVDGKLEYNVDDCANNEVLTIVIWYEPL